MDIKEKLDELENELLLAKNVMFSKKGIVDTKKCEEILSDIKRNLPSAIQEATYLISQKDKLIADAYLAAEQIKTDAKRTADHLVSESEILARSTKEANLVLAKVEKQCEDLYNNTKNNIDVMLKNIEEYMMNNLHIVRNNREELAGMLLPKKKKED